MMDKHPIRNSTIASVIAGIILAALGRIWPPAWAILSASVAVPVWVLALIALAVLGAALLRARVKRASVPGGPATSPRAAQAPRKGGDARDRKSTRLNSRHPVISYAVFC